MAGLISCQRPESAAITSEDSADSLNVRYATGFSAFSSDSVWHLTIHNPYPQARKSFRYLLVPHALEVPEHGRDVQVIRIPVRRMVATSTTHIPLLDYLGATGTLVGFPTPDYISSERMRARIDSGLVRNLGMERGMEPEILLQLNPDLIMGYSLNSDLGQLERLREAGIPYLLNSDYLEPHPLGRAEWIRVAGLLFGRSDLADSVFSSIAASYEDVRERAAGVARKPDALSGVVYGDTWFMPGGNNYGARLMKDAGINYLWSENNSSGFLELSFESVLSQAQDADLWIGVASFGSLESLAASESRYREFRAFREGNVYTYNRRIGATGGNEYLELGYLRPDLILADLVRIAHPEVLPDHSMYFYQRLE